MRGRLRMMPDGRQPGGADPGMAVGSVGHPQPVRSAAGRASTWLLPTTETPGPPADRSVGDIVGDRLGHEVVERLVDPLVGGINAGGVTDLSAEATFPPLLAADRQSGSLMRALRRPPSPGQTPQAPATGAGAAADAGLLVARRRAPPACPPSWPPP